MIKSSYLRAAFGSILAVACFILLIRTAWLCDDAYITFRTADNFVSGLGLTYNIIERVQTFTNPLWLIVISLFYYFSGEIYYTSLVLQGVISLTVMMLILFRLSRGLTGMLVAALTMLMCKAFVDYSTSGMENALGHLLLVIFLLLYFRDSADQRMGWMASIAALAFLNRADTILIYFPMLLYLWVRDRRWNTTRSLVMGLSPILLWEIFSLLYYGFPFPNTAYAKLGTGIPGSELMIQGLFYLLQSLQMDPVLLTVVLLGLLFTVFERNWRAMSLAFGVILYLLYVIKVGGDFMSGRFLTLPFVASVILVARSRWVSKPVIVMSVGIIIVVLGLLSPYAPIKSGSDYGLGNTKFHYFKGIGDERAFYYQQSGLLRARQYGMMPQHEWAYDGLIARISGQNIVVRHTIGYFGYFAGPEVHVIDDYGLSDPLIARLPLSSFDPEQFPERVIEPPTDWIVGHYWRRIPKGYAESRVTKRNVILDENLADYYDKLALVSQGDLFNWRRIKTIWELNTGEYDYLIDAYVKARHPRRLSLEGESQARLTKVFEGKRLL